MIYFFVPGHSISIWQRRSGLRRDALVQQIFIERLLKRIKNTYCGKLPAAIFKQRFAFLRHPVKKQSMNLKKLLILPAGFLFTNIMYITCCNCKPVNKNLYEAVNLLLKPSGSKNAIVDNGTPVFVDSLYLDCLFYTDCVANKKNNFSFLVNTANACSCDGCGDDGLKSKITAIEITGDNIYNGIAANSSLNSLFKTYNKYNLQNGVNLSIDSVISLININQMRLSDVNLYTKTKPGNALGHQLNLKATFANGSTFSSKTKPIYWQ
jgi:hypothetical protein